MADIVYAKSKIRAVLRSGEIRHYPPGSHWPASDPFVVANPDQFSTDPRYWLAFTEEPTGELDLNQVETASASPGERRSVRRPA
jgi:hypothetical protein